MTRLREGGLIDRARPLRFRFDGRDLVGCAGDTLASALLANGIGLVGRSFKYHRPRGIFTAGPEEPNALVTLRGGARAEPNTRATTVELFEGLVASSQNRWPGLDFDLMAVNGLLGPLFSAGFYYKTFMWPARLWERLYEPAIRRAAGLGALGGAPDPDRYDRSHAFCDLLVIGAGPSGLAAALAGARAGLRVLLVEDDWLLGGRLLSERHMVDGRPALAWVADVERELRSLPGVAILSRTTLFGAYDGEFGAVERLADHLPEPPPGGARQRYWKIVAKRAILATGAIERPPVFPGNDRPGVMTASALRTYVNRFAVAPGDRIVVFTGSDSGWAAAADLVAAGLPAPTIVDPRPEPSPALIEAARRAGSRVLPGAHVVATHGKRLRRVDLCDSRGAKTSIDADVLAVAGGWNPAIGIASHLGARPAWSDDLHCYLLDRPPAGMRIAGAAAGRFAAGAAIADGFRAGAEAASALGAAVPEAAPPQVSEDPAATIAPIAVPGRGKAFVDLQHDVTADDVALAVREGFRSVEHLKRYTTLGMATDQGRTSQVNGNALLAAACGRTMAEAGTILARPPWQPVAIAAFAGHHRDTHFRPVRLTPAHAWACEQGADFVDAGQWKRARWFARPGEQDWRDTVAREVRSVRGGVGLCDVSTLGKIELMGPDAGLLLDRLYINGFSSLAVGRARYGIMLREDGFILDDGTAARLAEDHYVVTTTTANAARVMQHVDFARQLLWPDLDVQAVSVTEQWAQFAIAGPRSRALLQSLWPDRDLADAAFPYMAAAELDWDGVPARLFRLSFSGERGYELAVPAQHGDRAIRRIAEAGRPFGLLPYGTEALGVMRIEKGHVAGAELNGQTTAYDLGFERMMSRRKDYVGRVMAARAALVDPNRMRLVGLRPCDRRTRITAGSHLLPLGVPAVADHDQGHVTSAAWSPTLDHPIALALLRAGPERWGERIRAVDLLRGSDVEVEVCNPVFVDPEGTRLHG